MRGMLWLCFFFFISVSFANQTMLSQQIQHLEYGEVTHDFFKHHQLIFFFASTCPHCHKAAPHLKVWADLHQADVIAVSFDRRPLPEFPHIVAVPEALIKTAFTTQPITFPALFMMNIQTNQLYPVMIGEWTLPELERRLDSLIEKVKRYEGGQR